MVKCRICGLEAPFLGYHVFEAHGLEAADYHKAYGADAPLADKAYLAWFEANVEPGEGLIRDCLAGDNPVKLAGVRLPYNADVPASACLKMPAFYRVPTSGKLAEAISQAAISIANKRSCYVWGLPGSGKDAFFHAFSASTRTPGIIRSIKPGVNIQAWFYSRTIGSGGTGWEVTPLFKALTEGYAVTDSDGNVIRRVPYMILFSDLDRADLSQTEHLRMILDSIEGRVEGPEGVMYDVFPGTVVVATGNSAGGGDERGRCLSAKPIDASIMDRFSRKFHFLWMEWKDELPVLQQKFPLLWERNPEIFQALGRASDAVRHAIADNKLYAELTHRGLCSILEHAEDMYRTYSGKGHPEHVQRHAVSVWVNGLGDAQTRQKAIQLMNPFFKNTLIGTGIPQSSSPVF